MNTLWIIFPFSYSFCSKSFQTIQEECYSVSFAKPKLLTLLDQIKWHVNLVQIEFFFTVCRNVYVKDAPGTINVAVTIHALNNQVKYYENSINEIKRLLEQSTKFLIVGNWKVLSASWNDVLEFLEVRHFLYIRDHENIRCLYKRELSLLIYSGWNLPFQEPLKFGTKTLRCWRPFCLLVLSIYLTLAV